MATIRSIIKQTLRRLNCVQANEEPTADDVRVCQEALNALIDSMSNVRLNIHTINPQRFLLTPGQQDYLLGPATFDGVATGADWVTERPMRIEQAVLIQFPNVTGTTIGQSGNTIFLPLQLANYAQFSNVPARLIQTTYPTAIYDNGAFPCRTLSAWPVPQEAFAVELWLWQPLVTYATLDEVLSLPPGYERYLVLKLAMEVAPEFSKQVTETLKIALQESENVVKTLNQEETKTRLSAAAQKLAGHLDPWTSGAPYSSPMR